MGNSIRWTISAGSSTMGSNGTSSAEVSSIGSAAGAGGASTTADASAGSGSETAVLAAGCVVLPQAANRPSTIVSVNSMAIHFFIADAPFLIF